MSTTWLGEHQNNQWYRTFFLFDQAVELEPATRYWFGVHWAAPGDYGGYAVLAAASTSQSGSYSMESLNGTFDNWTSNQSVDRAFRIYTPTRVFVDGFESGDFAAWFGSALF